MKRKKPYLLSENRTKLNLHELGFTVLPWCFLSGIWAIFASDIAQNDWDGYFWITEKLGLNLLSVFINDSVNDAFESRVLMQALWILQPRGSQSFAKQHAKENFCRVKYSWVRLETDEVLSNYSELPNYLLIGLYLPVQWTTCSYLGYEKRVSWVQLEIRQLYQAWFCFF